MRHTALRFLTILFIPCAVTILATPFPGEEASGGNFLVGRPRVVDGDTLAIGAVRIRIHGIDAPENRQVCEFAGTAWLCGREASAEMRKHIGTAMVNCFERDRDRYGRIVAMCEVDGEDIGRWMVRQGWAFAYRRYSRDYVAEETTARDLGLGIWRGNVEAPWKWRRTKRKQG